MIQPTGLAQGEPRVSTLGNHPLRRFARKGRENITWLTLVNTCSHRFGLAPFSGGAVRLLGGSRG
jgi:hypothetical protein